MTTMKIIEDSYQVAFKAEEKLARKQSQHNRGKIPHTGKGIFHDKSQKPITETEKSHGPIERGGSFKGRQYGGKNYFPRGRGRSRGGEVRCYAC